MCNMNIVHRLEYLLNNYETMKKLFDTTTRSNKLLGVNDTINSKTVFENIQELYKLKHNGPKIKELFQCQKKARAREHEDTEYVHNPPKPENIKDTKITTDKKFKTRKGNGKYLIIF